MLDIRTLKPLDEEALLASAAKTGRVVIVQEAPRTLGFAAELAAILAEKAILDLHGPVLRVTGYDVPYPYWQIEDAYMPSVERVLDAVRKLLAVLSDFASGSSAASPASISATLRAARRCAGPIRGCASCPSPGVSYRADALPDASFDPGRRLALVRGARERARPERGGDLERGAHVAGRLRPARRRARASAATSRRCRCGVSTAGCAC